MADCMLKISFLPFSSQHRWQHHHTYNTFLVENLFPDVCTYTQKYVARRSQGWSGWLFTRSHAITFHVQHHVTAVVYASLLRIMLRDEGECDCNFIISQFFYIFIYLPIHSLYNVCIAVHGSFLSTKHQTTQATMLTAFYILQNPGISHSTCKALP